MNRVGPATPFARFSGWLLCAPLVLLAIRIVQRSDATSIWDDSYMFVRYADGIIAGGVPSFYAGGPATYGLTSLAFLIVAVPMRLLFPANPVLAALGSSLFGGLAFLLLLGLLLRAAADATPQWRTLALAGVATAVAPATDSLARHFASGMDTTFALAYLSMFLLVAYRSGRSPGAAGVGAIGLLGGLAYAVRPDLLLFTLAIPFAALVLGHDAQERKSGALALAIALGAVAVQMAVFARTLHSPVPLAFFAKSTAFYGPDIRATYRWVPLLQWVRFAGLHLLLFGALAWAILRDPRDWWSRSSPLEKGLLGATLLFVAYYLFGVLQIMYYVQRFYYPTLPVVAFLAVRAVSRAWATRPPSLPRPRLLAASAILIALALPARIIVSRARPALPAPGRFDVRAEYLSKWQTCWFALDAFSDLPDDLLIATTEVGHPLAMNPRKRIVDLAGLNETSLVLGGVTVDRLLERLQPDLVYLPHPDYVSIARRVAGDSAFARRYEVWTARRLEVGMGVAIRRDGPHAAALRAIVESRLPAQ